MSDDSEFLRRRLDAIQTELRVIRDTADIDRRNTRSLYDNMINEMSRKLAAIDHKLELAAEHFEERMDRLADKLTTVNTKLDFAAERFEERMDRLEELVNRRAL